MARRKGEKADRLDLGLEEDGGGDGDSAPSDRFASIPSRDLPLAPVVSIGRGRPGGLGYDPSTGEVTHPRSKLYNPHVDRDSSAAEVDVFSLVDEKGYRADRFYTRSTNQDGHGEKMQVRLPQGIDSQVHAAVSQIPEYRSAQDLVRDAIVHRLEWLQRSYELSDAARRMVELERHTADMEAATSEVQRMTTAIEDMKRVLEMLHGSRDWGMVKMTLDNGDEMIEWMREPYKSAASQVLSDWRVRVKEDLVKWQRERDQEG